MALDQRHRIAEGAGQSEIADLRQFIDRYRAAYPEDVIETDTPINSKWEVSTLAHKLAKQGRYPLMIFHRVIAPSGKVSDLPVVVHAYGDRRKLGFAVETTAPDVSLEWARRLGEPGSDPIVLAREEAPIKQNVLVGDQVNLLDFPILHYHEMDPGAYLTAGMVTTYDPATHTVNSAFQRGWIAGPREVRIYMTSRSHNYLNVKAHEAIGEPTKLIIWLGHHPAVLMGANSMLDYPGDHYIAASRVARQPLRVVPSETLGDDVLVPADAELVIEGQINPGHYDLEGPFGEYPRYYGPQKLSPCLTVTAVTHRNQARFDSYLVGAANFFGSVSEERYAYLSAKRSVPSVQRVHVPGEVTSRFHCYVQLKKTHDSQPAEIIMAILSNRGRVKHVYVVDDDIDVFDPRQVEWAVATRSQWDRDVIIIPRASGAPLDPSADNGLTAKGGIDATKPAKPARFPLTLNVPDEVDRRLKLEDYFTPEQLRGLGSRP